MPPPAPARERALLALGQRVTSTESGLTYRVGELLGQGGFGQVFLAERAGPSDDVPETVCIKVSTRQDGWLREAYFGQLLHEQPRAVRLYDAIPFFGGEGRLLYGLAIEYARHGDLSAFLARGTKRFSEAAVRREIAGILHVLRKLHRGPLLHRDLTPLNVFVCDGLRLKLGDFGIVRQQSDHRGVTARTINPHMAPSDIFDGAAPKWQPRDDVYQVGQLLGMLVKGEAAQRVRTPEVRSLDCSDHLKEIIYRCIGERRKRCESADELIRALDQPPPSMKAGPVKSLKGARVAFTGTLSVPRVEAARAARTCASRPSTRTRRSGCLRHHAAASFARIPRTMTVDVLAPPHPVLRYYAPRLNRRLRAASAPNTQGGADALRRERLRELPRV